VNQTAPTRPQDEARVRLATLIRELGPEAKPDPPTPERPDTRAGRLVERWLPGGTRGADNLRTMAAKHRMAVIVVVIALLTAIGTAVVLAARQPEAEPAPVLAAAISAGPATTTPAPTSVVISVVGKVTKPGLVTLVNGARVADAIQAAGGLIPGTDDTALNLARRLSDGEQIYVGVPIPADATDTPQPPDTAIDPAPAPPEKKGKKSTLSADPTTKVNLNTATADQLQNLPGIGPTMAQRILTWRGQHGRFDSIGQLRDVGGIGDAKFAKLNNLVTT
jgi:competence protein ComEA